VRLPPPPWDCERRHGYPTARDHPQQPESLLAEWTAELKSTLSRKLIKDAELEEQCTAFLAALERGVSSG
jgi:hypothetical protein